MDNIRVASPRLGIERQTALEHWRAANDTDAGTDPATMIEAAMRAELIGAGEDARFEPVSFGELVTFITELPF